MICETVLTVSIASARNKTDWLSCPLQIDRALSSSTVSTPFVGAIVAPPEQALPAKLSGNFTSCGSLKRHGRAVEAVEVGCAQTDLKALVESAELRALLGLPTLFSRQDGPVPKRG